MKITVSDSSKITRDFRGIELGHLFVYRGETFMRIVDIEFLNTKDEKVLRDIFAVSLETGLFLGAASDATELACSAVEVIDAKLDIATRA